MPDADILNNPVFFDSTRVWRCYTGGKLLDRFLGNEAEVDANLPEDWLASVTVAENGEQQQAPDEGLAKVRGTDMHFASLLQEHAAKAFGVAGKDNLGVLCKFLDSAVRLPIQCHPDRAFAKAHCNSNYGKTESWLILATRQINGEDPDLLLGFKPDIDKDTFKTAVEQQDIDTMVNCLHKFPVKPGDVYFIPGRVPHAIGPGLLLLEVQEPTDLVVQPERQIGDVTLTEQQMWGQLDFDTAIDCFDYTGKTMDDITSELKLPAIIKQETAEAKLEKIIGPEHTDCFYVDKLTVTGSYDYTPEAPWHLGIVTSGAGVVTAGSEQPLKQGDRFFVSNQIKDLQYQTTSKEPLEIYLATCPG